MKRLLLLLLTPLLVSVNPVSAWERFDPDEGYKNCVDTALREWFDQEKWRSLNRVEKSAYKSLAHQRCNSSVPEQFQTDIDNRARSLTFQAGLLGHEETLAIAVFSDLLHVL